MKCKCNMEHEIYMECSMRCMWSDSRCISEILGGDSSRRFCGSLTASSQPRVLHVLNAQASKFKCLSLYHLVGEAGWGKS